MSQLTFSVTITPGRAFDARDLVTMLLEAAAAVNNLDASNIASGSLDGSLLPSNTLEGRHLVSMPASKLQPGVLTAANFLRTGAGSSLDADRVDGFHARDIGCLGVGTRTVNKDDFEEYAGYGLGVLRLTFTPQDCGRSSGDLFPDPTARPWLVGVELNASLMQSLGEIDSSNGGILAAPRCAGWYVENKGTGGFDVVLLHAYGERFWRPGGWTDSLTVRVSVVSRAV